MLPPASKVFTWLAVYPKLFCPLLYGVSIDMVPVLLLRPYPLLRVIGLVWWPKPVPPFFELNEPLPPLRPHLEVVVTVPACSDFRLDCVFM